MPETEKKEKPARSLWFWQVIAIAALAAAAAFATLWIVSMSAAEEPAERARPEETFASGAEEARPGLPSEAPGAGVPDVTGVSLEGKKVIVDAGHGVGLTTGTTGVSGVAEHEVNLAVAQKLKAIFEEAGAEVVMVREDENALSSNWEEDFQAREKIIRDADADFYLNIHQNEFDSPEARGPQVFFVAQGSIGKRLAVCIQEMMNYELEVQTPRMALEKGDRLLKTGSQPSCTIECGFMSNPEEDELLQDDAYRQRVAQSIADGVKLYVMQYG